MKQGDQGDGLRGGFMSRASAVLRVSLVALWLAPSAAVRAETVIYSENFDANPGSSFPGWSSSEILFKGRGKPQLSGSILPPAVTNAESPGGKRHFLGEFGGPRIDLLAHTQVRQTVRLALKGLAPHATATVSFDLLILKSWDGSSPQYGPDRWSLRVDGGPTLLDTTFSNNPKLETDKSFQDYPTPNSRHQTGAASVRKLGYKFFGDSTYHFRFTFPHSADSLTLEFSSDLFEGKGTGDESWGLDDVTISTDAGTGPKATLNEGTGSDLGDRRQARIASKPSR
jgi:hypothetical protein